MTCLGALETIELVRWTGARYIVPLRELAQNWAMARRLSWAGWQPALPSGGCGLLECADY